MRTSANANESNHECPDADLRRKIEERAYQIWLENGGEHGDHERHWLQTERELMEATKRGEKPQSDARLKKWNLSGNVISLFQTAANVPD